VKQGAPAIQPACGPVLVQAADHKISWRHCDRMEPGDYRRAVAQNGELRNLSEHDDAVA
jgi:hypothetical protein